MANRFESPYGEATEQRVKNVYDSLSEKDRRRYAAIEAEKLGRGGQRSIAESLGCSEQTNRRGVSDLDSLPDDDLGDRQRAERGGRKRKQEPEIEQQLFDTVDRYVAGDPDEDILWTHLSPQGLSDVLAEQGTFVSAPIIANWLEENQIRRRTIEKSKK